MCNCNCNCNRQVRSVTTGQIKDIASRTETVVRTTSSRAAIETLIENGIREALQLADVQVVYK